MGGAVEVGRRWIPRLWSLIRAHGIWVDRPIDRQDASEHRVIHITRPRS